MAYIGNSPGVSSQRITSSFIATAGQTVFVPISGYTLGYVDVYLIGVKLPPDDFTAGNGTSVILAAGTILNDTVELVCYTPRGLSDGYTRNEIDTRYGNVSNTSDTSKPISTAQQAALDLKVNSTNPNYTGTLTGGTGVVNIGSGQFYKDASGNVGVGTANPTSRLHVYQNIANTPTIIRSEQGSSGNIFDYAAVSATAVGVDGSIAAWSTGSTRGGQFWVGVDQAVPLVFGTGDTERMRLDASGNLGLGVTPSAWHAGGPGGQVIQTSSFALSNDANTHYQSNNTYYSTTGWKYLASKYATQYQQDSALGVHKWLVAPSGLTNNPISFTQAMTLDASGNLLVGSSTSYSSIYKMQVTGRSIFRDAVICLRGDGNMAGTGVGYLSFQNSTDGAERGWVGFGNGDGSVRLNNSVGPVHITSSGGTVSLDGSGNLLFPSQGFIRGGGANELILGANSGGLYQQIGGNYYQVNTTGGSTSDATLKKNVVQLESSLQKIQTLHGVKFEYIEDQKAVSEQGVQIGVIAQEVEAQFPEIVITNEDGIKSVRYEKLVAPLIEAIKEQQAQIEALTARITQLESA